MIKTTPSFEPGRKVLIPIPGAKHGDKQFGIQFDPYYITEVSLKNGFKVDPSSNFFTIRHPDGTSELELGFALHFEDADHRPQWVEVVEGPDGNIGSKPLDSNH